MMCLWYIDRTGPTAAGQGQWYVYLETSYGRQRGEEAA